MKNYRIIELFYNESLRKKALKNIGTEYFCSLEIVRSCVEIAVNGLESCIVAKTFR